MSYRGLGEDAPPAPVAWLGVQDFHTWSELEDADAQTRSTRVVNTAYAVGLLGGLLWGGLRGLAAGWAAAATVKYVIGTTVYWQQPDPNYRNVAYVTGGVAVVSALIAKGFADHVVDDKLDEGRSLFSFAH